MPASKRFEVEQKYRIHDAAKVETALSRLGATFGEAETQRDQYYSHPSRDFTKTDEALRIRRAGDSSVITYKGPKVDKTTKTRQELEVPILDGSKAAEQHGRLLEALGFRPVLEVVKRRRPGSLSWDAWRVEIALDEIDRLGFFLELEIVTTEDKLDSARAAIESLSLELEVGLSERRSYLELLLSSGST